MIGTTFCKSLGRFDVFPPIEDVDALGQSSRCTTQGAAVSEPRLYTTMDASSITSRTCEGSHCREAVVGTSTLAGSDTAPPAALPFKVKKEANTTVSLLLIGRNRDFHDDWASTPEPLTDMSTASFQTLHLLKTNRGVSLVHRLRAAQDSLLSNRISIVT